MSDEKTHNNQTSTKDCDLELTSSNALPSKPDYKSIIERHFSKASAEFLLPYKENNEIEKSET